MEKMRSTNNKGLFSVLYEDNWLAMGLSCLGQRPVSKRLRSERASGSDAGQGIGPPNKKRKNERCIDVAPPPKWFSSSSSSSRCSPEHGGKLPREENHKKYKGVRVKHQKNVRKHRAFVTLPKAVFKSLPSPASRSWDRHLCVGTFPSAEDAAEAVDLGVLALGVIDESNTKHDLSRASLLNFPHKNYPKESIELMHQFIYLDGQYIGVRSITWREHRVSLRNRIPLGSFGNSEEAAMCYDKACLAVFGREYEGLLNFDVMAYDEDEVACMFKFLCEKFSLRRLNGVVRSESEGVELEGYCKFVPTFQQGCSFGVGEYSSLYPAKRAYDLTRLAFQFHTTKQSNYLRKSYKQTEINDFRREMEAKYPKEVNMLINTFCTGRLSASSIIDQAFKNVKCRARSRVGCAQGEGDTSKLIPGSDSNAEVLPSQPDLGLQNQVQGVEVTQDEVDVEGLEARCSHWRSSLGAAQQAVLEDMDVDFVSVPCPKDEPMEGAAGLSAWLSDCTGGWGQQGSNGANNQQSLRSGVVDVGLDRGPPYGVKVKKEENLGLPRKVDGD